MTTILPRSRTLLSLAAVAIFAFFAAAGRADAGVLVPAASDCAAEQLEQPFAGDPASYFLVRDGSFSDGAAGWTLAGASVDAEKNGPVSAAAGRPTASLRLAAGASATTPEVCIGLDYPTMRFFARNAGGDDARLTVEVLFRDVLGNRYALPIGAMTGARAWTPSPALRILVNYLTLKSGERTAVSFRFTATGGEWNVDDVYVDPYIKG